jgi:hypothetical protein
LECFEALSLHGVFHLILVSKWGKDKGEKRGREKREERREREREEKKERVSTSCDTCCLVLIRLVGYTIVLTPVKKRAENE